MITFSRFHRVLLALGGFIFLLHPAPASPRVEALRHVPEDVGFCLVVQNLRGHYKEVAESPFAKQWVESSLCRQIVNSKEWRVIVGVEKQLAGQFGTGWVGVRDEILGDAFGFAYRPGPPGKPEQEQGLFFIRPRNPKLLLSLIAKLNEHQRVTGELKAVHETEYRGIKYHKRQEVSGTTFYLLRESVLLFSSQEALIRQIIDREKQNLSPDRGVSKTFQDQGLDRAFIALVINPRAWDAEVASKGGTDPVGKTVVQVWKALHSIGLGVHLERNLRVQLTFKGEIERLPASLRKYLEIPWRRSPLWSVIPEDALLACAGRIDLANLYEATRQFLSPAAQKEFTHLLDRGIGAMLGKNVVKELLPSIGPDCGTVITAPPPFGKQWFPNILIATRLSRGQESDPVDEAIVSGCLFLSQILVQVHNKQNPKQLLRLKSKTQEGTRARYLDGDDVFLSGVQPGFALKNGYLLIGSNIDLFRAFKVAKPENAPEVPLLRLSGKGWKCYLDAHGKEIAKALSKKDDETLERVMKQLEAIRKTLEWLQSVEIRQRSEAGTVSFLLMIEPTYVWKK